MPTPIARRGALGALAGSFALAAGRAPASAQGAARTAMTVLASNPAGTLPFHYAVGKGMFDKAGLDVTVVPSTGGSNTILAIAGSTAQFGYANTLSLSAAYLKGLPVALVAPGVEYVSATANAELLVLADSPIRAAKDLEGKIVGVTDLHDLLAVATYAWLDKGGAAASGVKFVEIGPATMLAALQQRRIDAAAIFEPYLSSAVASGARFLAKPYDAIALRLIAAAWFGNTTWMKEHRDATLRFARVMYEAQAYTNSHYEELVPMIADFSKVPVETLRKMPIARVAPTLERRLLQPLIDTAARYNELSTAFRAQELIFPGVPAG